MITIRSEEAADQLSVRRVNELAFGQATEADLVDALRAKADPYVSLVAIVDGLIVGHIFFSPVSIESETGVFNAIGLAPMAVLPEFQNKGIGSRLVDEGLKSCRELGQEVVVVLGHPNYYPRFGFIPAHLKGLRSEYDVPDDTFMVLELSESALSGRRGLVKYHPEFNRF
jgi:putative acetyltransferase